MRKALYALTIAGLLAVGTWAQQSGGAFIPSFDYDISGDWNFSGTIPTLTGNGSVVGTSATQTLTNKTLTSPTVNGATLDDAALTGHPTFVGTAATIADNFDASLTVTAATSDTRRLVKSAITLTPSTTFSVNSSGSITPIRGEITISASKTFVDGFLFGSQGKVTLNGTMAESSAGRITGVLGQVDLSTGTLTAGQVSAVWGDLQGNPTLTVNDQLYVGRFTNSMSAGKKAQAFALYYGASDLLFEASADGGTADWFDAASGTSAGECAQTGGVVFTQTLQVNVMGTNYWIPLCTAP